MRWLEAIRLVHWYHFQDETFRLDGNCLFLGDNGHHRPAERFRILNGLETNAQVKVRDKVKIVVD